MDDRSEDSPSPDRGDEGLRRADDGRRQVRYTRRRFLRLLGGLLAGSAGAAALWHWIGGGRSGPAAAGGGAKAGGREEFPVLNVEATPATPPERWVVTVDGLVDKPLRVDHTAWLALTRVEQTADFHCVEGWSVDALRWSGVSVRTLLDQAGVKPEGKAVTFHAAGGTYADSLSLQEALDPHTMLADMLDGAPLPAQHGGPARLIIPSQLGYKNVKWVVRLEVTAERESGYWEQRGYPVEAPVR